MKKLLQLLLAALVLPTLGCPAQNVAGPVYAYPSAVPGTVAIYTIPQSGVAVITPSHITDNGTGISYNGVPLGGTGTVTVNGTVTPGHCVSFLGGTVIQDSGSACGSGAGFVSSLTTTGNSGAATVTGGVLNIPNYTFTQTFPSVGIMVSTGSAFGTSLTPPSSAFVGISDTQTLTNKSIAATQLTGTVSCAQQPAATGDVAQSAGSCATTVNALKSLTLPTLAGVTGYLYDNNGSLVLQIPSAGYVQSLTTTGTSGVATVSGGVLNIPNYTSPFLSLTTTGSTGAATLSGGVLNIPQYAGTSQTYPSAGIMVSNGTGFGTSLTAPASALVGISDTQTLTNKSIVATQLTGTINCAQEPASTGDVTQTAGTCATTVVALRNIALPTLAASTGYLYDNNGVLSLQTSAGYVSSLTTTGTSGVATVSGGVLNIPNYTNIFTSLTTTGSYGAATLSSGVLNVPTFTGGTLASGLILPSITINGTNDGQVNLVYTGTAGTGPATNTFQISPLVAITTPWTLSPAAAPPSAQGVMEVSTSGQMSFVNAPSSAFVGVSDTQTLTNKSIAASQLTGVGSCAQEPAMTGDATSTAGSCATTVGAVNGGAIPTTIKFMGTNSSGQFVATSITANSVVGNFTGSSGVPTAFVMPTGCSSVNFTPGTGFVCSTAGGLTDVTDTPGNPAVVSILNGTTATNPITFNVGAGSTASSGYSAANTLINLGSAGNGQTSTTTVLGDIGQSGIFIVKSQYGNLLAIGGSGITGYVPFLSSLATTFHSAASLPAGLIQSPPYSAGTATTNEANFYIDGTAGGTQPTTWSTAGTEFGINNPSGFAGNILDFHTNGGASLFNINAVGAVTNNITPVASQSGILFTNSPYAGTGTTSFPMLYFDDGASAVTNLATGGEYIGVNAHAGFTGDFFHFSISGSGYKAGLDYTGTVSLAHYASVMSATVAVGAAAPGGTATLTSGHDGSFQLNAATSATTPVASSVLATVTFGLTYGVTPHCTFSPKNAASALAITDVYITTTTTTAVFNVGATALPASTSFVFDAICEQ